MTLEEGGPAAADRGPWPAPLERAFYAREAEVVAAALLGAVICRRIGDSVLRARLVETEAYVGCHDAASHSSRGRTPRNSVMFGPPGHAYVYLVYGLHHMLNVVTGRQGDGQAVLLRAAEPLDGLAERMDGPGRLARALGVTRDLDGLDLVASKLWLTAGAPPERVVSTPRVGVDYAGEWAQAPLRFLDGDSDHVSRPTGREHRLRLASGRAGTPNGRPRR